MSQERVLRTLEDLGLTELDARVYLFLGKRGSHKGQDIAKALKVRKEQVYRNLNNLQSKGIVSATLDHPARYSAEPFQKVLDLFIEAKMKEAQRLRESKDSILQDWQSIAISENGAASERFAVIKGRNIIYSKIQQMIQQTKKQLSTMTTVPNLVRADQFGLFNAVFEHPKRGSIYFRFLTELSEKNLDTVKNLLTKIPKQKFHLEIRIPDLGLSLLNRMVIRDDEEAVFFINRETDSTATEQDDVCLWTNCKSMMNSFVAVFDDLWHGAIDMQKKIVEIETGEPSPKTCVINDAEMAQKKYDETLHSAKEEIIMITSSGGLIESWKNIALLRELVGKSLSVRIMAPITSENLQAAQKLSEYCEVRHALVGYPEITVVDSEHIFQFKNPSPNEEEPKRTPYFGNTFYTSDVEYVEKTKSMLNDIWRNALAPSAITLDSIIKPPMPAVVPFSEDEYVLSRPDSPYKKISHGVEEKTGILSEKDILNKIINAKKYPAKNWPKDIMRFYGSAAISIIHPPSDFNLPDMMIWLMHYNKQSSSGAEDLLMVYLWLETPQGYAYVPVVLVTDNPTAVESWKAIFAGTPAGQNCRLVRKSEFQVQVHSDIVFAAWTVSIPLLLPSHALPPSCILFERYSKIKPGIRWEYGLPSGVKVSIDANGFEAFVTFFHPLTKYSGAGTDAIVGRDVITTLHPP